MKERTTILLDRDLLDLLKGRAKRKGTTVTSEIREAVARYVVDEHPNAGLLRLAGMGASAGAWPPVDSEEAKAEFLADLERDTFNPEPTP